MMHSLQSFFYSILHFLPKLFVCLATLVGIVLVPLGLPGVWLIVASALTYSYFYDYSAGHSDF